MDSHVLEIVRKYKKYNPEFSQELGKLIGCLQKMYDETDNEACHSQCNESDKESVIEDVSDSESDWSDDCDWSGDDEEHGTTIASVLSALKKIRHTKQIVEIGAIDYNNGEETWEDEVLNYNNTYETIDGKHTINVNIQYYTDWNKIIQKIVYFKWGKFILTSHNGEIGCGCNDEVVRGLQLSNDDLGREFYLDMGGTKILYFKKFLCLLSRELISMTTAKIKKHITSSNK